MKKYSAIAICMLAASSMPVNAKDIRDQWNIQISKAELVFPGTAPHDAANGIKTALSQFAIPASLSYRAMPSTPPDRPGTPTLKPVGASAPSPEYVCEDSYAEISKRPPPVQNAFVFIAEGHQVCLYSFAKGVKAYVIYYNIKKTESLTSGLFNGITRAIRGSDEDRAASQLKENIDAIRAKLPGVLVERMEIPGRPEETPDREAVVALIPPVKTLASVANTTEQAAAATTVMGSPLQAKVDARKSLNAMGMTYHSQQQFVEAIRRKDEVAVQLFIEGGGIRMDATDSSGKTPLQIAQAYGNPETVALLQPRAQAAASPPATADLNTQTSVASGVPTMVQPASPNTEAVDFTKVPAEFLTTVDEQLARLNLSAEEKQMARTNSALHYLNIRAVVDSLKR